MGAQQQGMPGQIKPDCPIGGIHGGCLLGGSPVRRERRQRLVQGDAASSVRTIYLHGSVT
jgi:hypothetical protein